MWNVAGTHTRTKTMAHNFTHTGKVLRVQRRKGGGLEGRIKYYGDIYLLCDVELYIVWCGMSVVWMDYRVWSGAEWCGEEERMVWNGGVKLRCGVECHGVILNVLWYGYVRFSVQSSLLFLYYVVFSVMSVLYCLCVSRIQCTQCSVSVFCVGSVL